MRYIYFLLLIGLFLVGCHSAKKYDIEIKELKIIGNNDDLIFANIRDIELYNNHLYVMDSDLFRLYKIDINSYKYNFIQFNKGKGPGEFTFHPGPFIVFADTIVILDEINREMEFFTLEGKPLFSKKFEFMPHDIFSYKDSIYVSGNSKDNIIYAYDRNGNLGRSFIQPFFTGGLSVNWFSEICMHEDTFYITDPYSTRIIKWAKNLKWEYNNKDEILISKPQKINTGKKYAFFQTSGWAGLFVKDDLLFASTFSVSKDKNRKKPHLLVIDTEKGRLVAKKQIDRPFRAKSFNRGKDIFAIKVEPFPCIVRVNIELKEL